MNHLFSASKISLDELKFDEYILLLDLLLKYIN